MYRDPGLRYPRPSVGRLMASGGVRVRISIFGLWAWGLGF